MPAFVFRMATAEVNGSSALAKEEDEPMDVSTTHTENYQTLLDAGLPQKVAESLDNIFQTGGLLLLNFIPSQSHLHFRASHEYVIAENTMHANALLMTTTCNGRFGSVRGPG